ncbi:BRO-N domain-containing protein, partial [Vibrio cholerae]
MTSVLTFQDTHFDVVERNNQLYLDAYQIGTALGYSDPRTAVRKIFNRNKDEFSSGMSEVINLMT